jgi:hypothetical protein
MLGSIARHHMRDLLFYFGGVIKKYYKLYFKILPNSLSY